MRILLALLSLFLFLPATAGKEVRVYKGDSPFLNDVLFTVRDGKVYKTVTFTFNGITQTWMAENLTYSSATITPVLDSALRSRKRSTWKSANVTISIRRHLSS